MIPNVDESVLLESRSARDSQIISVTEEQADAALKAHGLMMAYWHSSRVATTAQIAEFYQVQEASVRQLSKKYRDELESDGLRIVKTKQLAGVSDLGSLSPNASTLTLWTPRAALRLGMLLRNNSIAKAVRESLLDMAATAGHQIQQIDSMQVELARLHLELEKERNRGKELDSAMIAMHGRETVLMLQGKGDFIVHDEIIVTEVVDAQSRTSERVLSADEMRWQIKQKTGQDFKTLKSVVEFLKANNRDDLIVAVRRNATSEYVKADALDEVVRIINSSVGRQKLIGE